MAVTTATKTVIWARRDSNAWGDDSGVWLDSLDPSVDWTGVIYCALRRVPGRKVRNRDTQRWAVLDRPGRDTLSEVLSALESAGYTVRVSVPRSPSA